MVNKILWIIFIALLGVLLPHTEWAFRQFEPLGSNRFTSWAAAFAFEAAIAALTHKLAKRIEATPKRIDDKAKFKFRYLNPFSFGLILALVISTMANLAHAVEFGQTMLIFAKWNIPFGLYAFAFGAILPIVSFTFANVLSTVVETESDEDPEVIKLKESNKDLQKQLRESEHQRKLADARFDALGDVFVKMSSNDKRVRILAVYERWPKMPQAAIALLCDSSAAHVSEVLSEVRLLEA